MRVCFLASKTPKAQESLSVLKSLYTHYPLDSADVVVALGGDGFMIEVIHKLINTNIPVYGMNRGTIGFLLNSYSKNRLESRISNAQTVKLSPLKMVARTIEKEKHTVFAINEVSLLRETSQTANIRISLDKKVVIENMVGDGVMIATPAGSTAYNFSSFGPILPLESNVLAMTPISPFRPKRWRGAIIPNSSKVCFKVLQPQKRPVSVTADFVHIRNISEVTIYRDDNSFCTLLFDEMHNLENRIIKEQFS